MSSELPVERFARRAEATLHHRVQFFETDAMGIVHHSNHIRFFELARVAWMQEHHCPYTDYMSLNLNFATTRAQADYLKPITFDQEIEIVTWLEWARGASIGLSYIIQIGGTIFATGTTEHALVDEHGNPRRIPNEKRRQLKDLSAESRSTNIQQI